LADYTQSAFYKVRKWMLQELYTHSILTENHYTKASAIVPIQQIPEAGDNRDWQDAGLPADAPFIVYDFLIPGSYDTDFWNMKEEIMLWIYDYDVAKVLQIRDFLVDLFRRYDLTAADVNEFSDPESPFIFHYFDIMTGLPSDEADQVLGRVGANLVLTYQYTRPIQSNGRFA
jgi:hypothetical protein